MLIFMFVCMCQQIPEARRGFGCHEAGVTGDCEPPSVGVSIKVMVLWEEQQLYLSIELSF